MRYIGRTIYYSKATGGVLFDTGERKGHVHETTPEQDFPEFDSETMGIIKLAFGQDVEKFKTLNYSINPETQEIIWGLPLE